MPSMLGVAEEVSQERFGDDECIVIRGTKAHPSASVDPPWVQTRKCWMKLTFSS